MKNEDYQNKKDGSMKYEKLDVGRVFYYRRAYWFKLENGQAGCIDLDPKNKKNRLGQLINLKPEIPVCAISYIEIG